VGWNPIRGITNAVRGVGRLVRGKVKEGLGDIVGGIPQIAGLALGSPLGGVVGGLADKASGLVSKIPGVGKLGSLGGIGGDVLEWAKQNPDLLLGGANAIMGINDLQNAGQYKKRALSRLETPERENLDPMFADPGNVYARPLRGVGRMVK
jgi:hypothetical protein